MLFYIDSKGDSSLSSSLLNDDSSSSQQLQYKEEEEGTDFIRFPTTRQAKKALRKKQKKNQNRQHRQSVSTAEQESAVQDYIRNVGIEALEATTPISGLASLDLAGHDNDDDERNSQGSGLEEEGFFSKLTELMDDSDLEFLEELDDSDDSASTDEESSTILPGSTTDPEGYHLLNDILVSRESMGLDPIDTRTSSQKKNISKNQARRQRKEAKKEKRRLKDEAFLDRQSRAKLLGKALDKAGNRLEGGVTQFLKRENQRIHEFVISAKPGDSLILTPTPAAVRALVYDLASKYNLQTKTRGKSKNKISTVFMTTTTHIPENGWTLVDSILEKAPSRLKVYKDWLGGRKKQLPEKKKMGAPDATTVPKMGDVVGGKAKPIGDSNIGHQMLLKMGWSPGDTLGKSEQGLAEPIEVVVRSKRGGLGAE